MRAGSHVVMAGRSMQQCESVRRELHAMGLPGSCSCVECDLDNPASVRTAAKRIQSVVDTRREPLRILINNAGVMGSSAPGNPAWEEQFGSASAGSWSARQDPHLGPNHLGPFLLTELLAPALGPGSRVINVGSRAHYQSPVLKFGERGDILGDAGHWYGQYARSKLCNALHVAELRRRRPHWLSVCVSPGRVATDIFQNVPWPLNLAIGSVAHAAFQTPQQGAAHVIAALHPRNSAALYTHLSRPAQPSSQVLDEALARKLWEASQQYVSAASSELSSGSTSKR